LSKEESQHGMKGFMIRVYIKNIWWTSRWQQWLA